MKQVYHSNAVTNLHIRSEIRNSNLTNLELAAKFNTSVVTISKWKNRTTLTDNSSAPSNVNYALNDIEQSLITSIRRSWFVMKLRIIVLILLAGCTPPTNNKIIEEEKELQKKWQYEYNMAYGVDCPPTVFSDSLVVMTGDINLSCFRINDGSLKWKTQIDDEVTLQTRVLLNYNGNIFGTHIEDVRAWNLGTGKAVWMFPLLDDKKYLAGSFSSIGNNVIYIAGYSDIKAINVLGDIKYTAMVKG